MPHQCADCNTQYEDGSKTILSGCDSCGGKTFEYISPTREASNTLGGGVITTGNATGLGQSTDDKKHPQPAKESLEDEAQTRARSELANPPRTPQKSHTPQETSADPFEDESIPFSQKTQTDKPDLESVRKELNRQFEGIKVLSPGKYEINLTQLFKRDECIIALQEDGRYVISFPESAENNS